MERSREKELEEEGRKMDEDEIMEEAVGVDSGKKLKRNRELTKGSIAEAKFDIKQVYPLIRDRRQTDEYTISLSYEFWFDPPKIARFLDLVTVKRKHITQLKHNITTGDQVEIEKCTKELGDMIITDPRLAGALEEHFYKLLVDFLCNDQNPVLQLNTVNILVPVVAYTKNREMVIKYIKPSMILNLLRSKDCNLKVESLWLLRSMVLAFPNRPEIKIKPMIEEVLESITHFITEYSPDRELCSADYVYYRVLYTCTKTLAAICQEHPQLPRDKLKWALAAIKKLIQYVNFGIASSACKGFANLCNGNKEVVVTSDDLNYVIEQLIVLIQSRDRENTTHALEALGSIVRWGSDDNVEFFIYREGLWELECLLREEDKYFVTDPCWILSNITARKEKHIDAVIEHECIESLAGVIKNHKLAEVKEEATWAISNAIRRARDDQIICLRNSVIPLWDSLNTFSDDPMIVCACLESLFRMECLKVTCNGEMVNDAEFNKYLSRLQEKKVQLADDIEGSPKSKRLRATDSIGKDDGKIVFHLSAPNEKRLCATDSIGKDDGSIVFHLSALNENLDHVV